MKTMSTHTRRCQKSAIEFSVTSEPKGRAGMRVAFALFLDPKVPSSVIERLTADGEDYCPLVWWIALRNAGAAPFHPSMRKAMRGASNDNARPVVLVGRG